MSSIFDLLSEQLGGDNLKRISDHVGADERTTGNAMSAALPTLLGALSRNASRQDGAEALSGALSRDHDGSILDNLSGFLGKPEAGPGEGILKHVLGNRRPAVESSLGGATGMSQDSIGKLLKTLAPVVMGALGKEQRRQGMDAGTLAGFLNRERQEVERRAPQEMGLIGKLLDTDDDGDVDISDIAKHGFKLFGKLLDR
jgi:hypothetical protein